MNVIEQALKQYIDNPQARDQSLAAELSAVPLYHGWTGTVFLTTTGQFLFRDEESDPPVIRPELDGAAQLTALSIAAEQGEWLANLLPERLLDSENCGACEGHGSIRPAKRSSIRCGQCHGLGWVGAMDPAWWRSEIVHPKASYVPFEEGIRGFRTFASSQGLEGDIVFITAADIAIWRRQMYVRIPNQNAAWSAARAAYKAAVRNRRGVLIAAACRLPGQRLGIYVYAPGNLVEAVESLFPDGLKLSVPAEPSTAVLVSGIRFCILRTLQRAFPPPFAVEDLLR
ncbi:MAG TPA: hypothetical protein VKB93_22285 [Thermoanaerobaculia bacterium]|nr:hypothetical protein [Thermoanaerobaculia bacterium]